MPLAISLIFAAHSILCAAYLGYLLMHLVEWSRRPAPGGLQLVDGAFLEQQEADNLHGVSVIILGLYLLFSEVYLYRLYLSVLGAP